MSGFGDLLRSLFGSAPSAPSRISESFTSQMRAQLIRDEGIRLNLYRDTEGFWTIGIGHNLDAKSISRRAADLIFEDDLADVERELRGRLPWTDQLNDARRGVLVNMLFNMGLGSLESGRGLLSFHATLSAVEHGDWTTASQHMLQSKWAGQVGDRALRLARQMREGRWI